MGGIGALHRAGALLAPWAGMIGGFAGWALSDQIGSSLVIDDCRNGTPWLMLVIGLAGLSVALWGAAAARRVWRSPATSEGRRFVAQVGMGVAAMLSLAILFQTAAALIIPRCLA